MRFCLQISHRSWSGGGSPEEIERTFDLIRTADRSGFDSVWITEDPEGWDAFAILAAAAGATEQIRLGTGVTNPYLRHPNLIAASVSTLDRLSNGRAFLGLGRGQPEWYRTALGMNVHSPLAAVESTLQLLRQWWTPPFAAHGSDPFPVADWERTIRPAGPSLPPMYLAATGPRMLVLAGQLADGVRFNELASMHFLRNAVAQVKRAADEATRDPDGLSFFAHPAITITDDREAALERRKTTVALIHALPGMDQQLETPGIDVHAIMEQVRYHMKTNEILAQGGGFPALRRGGDLRSAKRAIPLELMERVAIAGDPQYVRARLNELQHAGISHVFLDIDRLSLDPGAVERLIGQLLPDSP